MGLFLSLFSETRVGKNGGSSPLSACGGPQLQPDERVLGQFLAVIANAGADAGGWQGGSERKLALHLLIRLLAGSEWH
jgi:hypothetical protein